MLSRHEEKLLHLGWAKKFKEKINNFTHKYGLLPLILDKYIIARILFFFFNTFEDIIMQFFLIYPANLSIVYIN